MADIFNMPEDANMEEVMKNLHATDVKHNKYRFNRCIDRNIVLIGRSRTGKSTLAKVIGDIFYRPDARSLFSEARTVEFHKVATDDVDGTRYYFNVVDTPGFFEQTTTEIGANANARIKQFLDGCIAHDVTNVHLFALVFSLGAGINSEDIITMKYIKDNYPDLGQHMALVVTHCEELAKEERQKLIADFFQHHEVKACKLADFFVQGVFYMGCFRHEAFAQKNEKAIYAQYKHILEMRSAFIDKCIGCKEPFNVHKHKNTSCSIL